jgi:hypothetical protein
VRWFDHWLKGVDNGVEAEPALTWFHRDPTPPERFPAKLNGRWQATRAWPPAAPRQRVLHLGRGSLSADPDASGVDTFVHRPTAGSRGGSLCWGAGHPPNGLASDLRLEADAGPLYTSEPLAGPLDILGVPVAVLHVASSSPVSHLVVRLADVAPDGPVEQVCEGILNLTHRDSHERPEPLEPGRFYEVRVPLRGAGYRFPVGHRVQLSVASAHWPVIWPSPGAAELSIRFGPEAPSRLELPLAPSGDELADAPVFRSDPPGLAEVGRDASEPSRWEAHEDAAARTFTIETHEGQTSVLPGGRSTLYVGETLTMTASEREPGVGRFENSSEYRLDREGRRIVVVADGTTTADQTAFDMQVGLRVDMDGERFFQREWHETVARDLT